MGFEDDPVQSHNAADCVEQAEPCISACLTIFEGNAVICVAAEAALLKLAPLHCQAPHSTGTAFWHAPTAAGGALSKIALLHRQAPQFTGRKYC